MAQHVHALVSGRIFTICSPSRVIVEHGRSERIISGAERCGQTKKRFEVERENTVYSKRQRFELRVRGIRQDVEGSGIYPRAHPSSLSRGKRQSGASESNFGRADRRLRS